MNTGRKAENSLETNPKLFSAFLPVTRNLLCPKSFKEKIRVQNVYLSLIYDTTKNKNKY